MNELTVVQQLHDEAARMAANNTQMMQLVANVARTINDLSARISALEKLMADTQRVTVSHAQTLAIKARIRARAEEFCESNALPSGSETAVRRAIGADVKAQYAVKDLHDLPANYFNLVVVFVGDWTSRSLARKLRSGG